MKPDNFPFSEEIFEEIEYLRKEVMEKKYPKDSLGRSIRPAELDARLLLMSNYVFSKEYFRFEKEQYENRKTK